MKISPQGNVFTMLVPDNGHAHFRDGLLLEFLVPIFVMSGWRGRVVAEPNLLPPILTGPQAIDYAGKIRRLSRLLPEGQNFDPVPTIQITEDTTSEMVLQAFRCGVRVCKVYPRYVTTHSEYGVVDYFKIYPALGMAEELGMIDQFHAEHPSYGVPGRLKEQAFIAILDAIRLAFPKLRISIEHVSTKVMIEWVKAQPAWVGASLTIQHMTVTADELSGYSERGKGRINVHDGGFKPGAKDPEDLDAIQDAALSGNPKFWYGGDDAPHLKKNKECEGMCGAWNTIAALSMLATFFEKWGLLENLEPFLCKFWADFYGYPQNVGEMIFVRERWIVEDKYEVPGLDDSIVPFFAGETMEWKIAE